MTQEPTDGKSAAPPGGGATETAVQAWSDLLRGYLRRHHRSLRSMERECGWSSGYLSQVLRPGAPALKVAHVLAILQCLGVPPREFLTELYALPLPAAGTGAGLPADRAELEALIDQRIAEQTVNRADFSAEVRRALLGGLAALGRGGWPEAAENPEAASRAKTDSETDDEPARAEAKAEAEDPTGGGR